ncbi:hypothetical protein Tco_0412889 [Tanacetum coccineum]
MGEENPIRTLGDYSKPSHKGYRNTIDLPAGNNVVNKITTPCEICSGSHDTQYCMENPEQAFVEYASSRTDEAGEEPEPTLEDEFQDLNLNLLVLEVLAHAPIYNAILDKYFESLELGKNRSPFVQGEAPAKMGDPGLFTLPCRLGDSKPFDTLADVGSCTVETASRLTRDAVTMTPVTGSPQPRRRQTPRLYLMRRSLEVLRKFHWMILGGRFNQLSHVSSPLLSKPGEY